MDEFLKGLAKLSPAIGTAMSGPVGGLIGLGVKVAAEAITGKTDPAEILQTLTGDPEKLAALAERTAQLELEALRIAAADRANARERDKAYVAAGRRNARADLMVLGDVLGLVACLLAIFFLPSDAPGELRGLLATIAAYFGLGLRDAHQFEFGSSRGSKEKDTAIAGMFGR